MNGKAEGERGSGHVAYGAGSALARPGGAVTWTRAAWAAAGSAAGPAPGHRFVPLTRNGRPSPHPAGGGLPGFVAGTRFASAGAAGEWRPRARRRCRCCRAVGERWASVPRSLGRGVKRSAHEQCCSLPRAARRKCAVLPEVVLAAPRSRAPASSRCSSLTGRAELVAAFMWGLLLR